MNDKFISFAKDILKSWPDGNIDGGDLQDIAVKHGLLIPKIMYAHCGESCNCADVISTDEMTQGVECFSFYTELQVLKNS